MEIFNQKKPVCRVGFEDLCKPWLLLVFFFWVLKEENAYASLTHLPLFPPERNGVTTGLTCCSEIRMGRSWIIKARVRLRRNQGPNFGGWVCDHVWWKQGTLLYSLNLLSICGLTYGLPHSSRWYLKLYFIHYFSMIFS